MNAFLLLILRKRDHFILRIPGNKGVLTANGAKVSFCFEQEEYLKDGTLRGYLVQYDCKKGYGFYSRSMPFRLENRDRHGSKCWRIERRRFGISNVVM